MSAKAIEAAKAFVKVAWEDSAVRKGMVSAFSMIRSFAARVTAISFGNLLADGFRSATAAVFDFVEAGAAIDDIAKRTGAGAEGLSALKYAAEQSGASIQDIEKGMRKLADVETEAARGGSTAAKALGRVGLSAKDLDGLSPEEKLLAISEGLSKIEDPAERSSLAMDLLGKSGANLLPMMEDGAEGIQKMMDEAGELGMIVSGEQAAAAAEFDDTWHKATGTLAAVGKMIAAVVLPYMTSFLNVILQAVPVVMMFGRDLGNAIVSGASAAWSAISELLTVFDPLVATVKDSFSAITNALMSGEYAAAGKVLWTGLKAAWLTGIDALNREWILWKKAFLDVFNTAMANVQRAWHKTQNMLSKGVVEVMAFFDASINADEVNAELDSMLQQQLKAVDASVAADQEARNAKFETDVLAVNNDLAQAREEWKAAVENANKVSEKKANEVPASEITEDKFTKLLNDLKAGDVATRINDTIKQSNGALQDVRSVSGASQLTSLINQSGQVNRNILVTLKKIAENTAGLSVPPQVVNI